MSAMADVGVMKISDITENSSFMNASYVFLESG